MAGKSRTANTRATRAAQRGDVRRGSVKAGTLPSARGQVFEMQRTRLIGAAVPVVEKLGWSSVTVADIASEARVSRRTFYDLFENREECLLALLEETVARVERDLAHAGLEDVGWVERVRTGLWTILCFLDRDPVLARVCVVQSARGTRQVLEARETLLARVASVFDEGRAQSKRAAQTPVLTAEGLAGAALAIVYKRLLNGEQTPLTDLHGELLGMIVQPYLGSAAASRERKRPAPRSRPPATSDTAPSGRARPEDPLRDIPMRLTYRTARVLQSAGEHPGASNHQIGEHADMYDQGQISRLLARLERLGLLTNSGEGQARGESNAWQLTPLGERVTTQLSLPNPAQGDDARKPAQKLSAITTTGKAVQ
jgi:AcrR family transcriptional regulator/DNA-binding MarR family transcriptional regulator